MGWVRPLAQLGRASGRLTAVLVVLATTAGAARAFSGTVRYEGDLGPVTARKPLCLCLFTDPQLTNGLGCQIYRRNDVGYQFEFGDRDYYLVAFLDLHINERLDADEPFEIFDDRGGVPGDPVNGRSTRADVDFVFGDEHLAAAPTQTPTATPSATPTTAETPTATSPPAVAGDCDGDRGVSVAELVRAVAIALESLPLSACTAADRDVDGRVRIEELIAALNAALDG